MNDDRQNDPKYDFKAPEDNINKWQPKKWENQAFQGVSPFDFAMRQKNEEKKRKELEREAKARMYAYHAKGVSTLAEENAKQVNAQYKQSKEEAKRSKEEATKVIITETVETAVRAEQFGQEKAWKNTKKLEIESLKNVVSIALVWVLEQLDIRKYPEARL
jgi:protoporphyrinogen oxidase